MLLENIDKFYQSTRYRNPENHNFDSEYGEKLKLLPFSFFFLAFIPSFSLFYTILSLFYFTFL